MANQNSKNTETLRRMARMAELIQDQELLNKIGLAYTTLVRRRTQKGKDIHGKQFVGYSEQYAKKRKREGEPTHPVNLTMDHVSGMISKLDHVVFKDLDGVKAYINDPDKAQIGRYHAIEGAGTSKVIREWWGLTEDEEDKIRDTIVENLNEIFQTEL